VRSRLLVRCPDRPGIVAAIATHLFDQGANIVSSAQHSGEQFSLRMEFDHKGDEVAAGFDEIARRLLMDFRFVRADLPKRMAILVSREEHCLLDLLWRQRRGELFAEIPVVISNHDDARADVESFGVRFLHIPNDRTIREGAEQRMLAELAGADVVVLARYMQILSGDFLDRLGVPVINIHHSFLPAFAGANPYERAFERGVKIIGATAHYVTEHLDEGPIIEQDVARVTHADDVEALRRTGADIERAVLARAVRWQLEDRIVLDGQRTVVF
jgi:formyltetrahydrofolate deformylase